MKIEIEMEKWGEVDGSDWEEKLTRQTDRQSGGTEQNRDWENLMSEKKRVRRSIDRYEWIVWSSFVSWNHTDWL